MLVIENFKKMNISYIKILFVKYKMCTCHNKIFFQYV